VAVFFVATTACGILLACLSTNTIVERQMKHKKQNGKMQMNGVFFLIFFSLSLISLKSGF